MVSLDITQHVSLYWEVKVHQQYNSTKTYSFTLPLHAAFSGMTDTESKSDQNYHLSFYLYG